MVENVEAGVKSATVSAHHFRWRHLLNGIVSLFQCPVQPTDNVTVQTKELSSPSRPEPLQETILTASQKLSSASSTTANEVSTPLQEIPYIQATQAADSQPWLVFRHPSTLVIAVSTFVITTLLLVCAGTLLFRYCMNPRRRADRAARREERIRRKMYRSAACRYKIRQFFAVRATFFQWPRRETQVQSNHDEQEKHRRVPIPSAEDMSHHVLGASILSMQDTTIFVDRFLRGASHSKEQINMNSDLDVQSTASSPSERTQTTLPAYSLPPAYSPDPPTDSGHDHIAAGFAYTPSHRNTSSSGRSPISDFCINESQAESSAVDLDSRLSEDTETETETDSVKS